MVLSAGSEVSGYRIERVLGAGGMGTVYLAANPVLPRQDALKVLSAELSQDPAFRARFTREADLAATLDHPNIVTVYTRGESDDGQLWIAMQYVAGSDAENELRDGKMTPQRAVHIVGEVAKALDYAHRRNLLHRDVKPANFLLAPEDERVFLADFGIARALDEAVGLTQTGMVMASVAYAAPESLGGEGVDSRADIYSLGCSLFRLLSGKTPFSKSGGMAAMAAAHLAQPPPRVTELVPALPPAMDAVIAKAMAKEPADRYQTARELAAAAAAALDDTTGEVRTAPTPPVPRGWTPGPTGAPTQSAGHTPPQHRLPPPPGIRTGPEGPTYPGGHVSGPRVPAAQPYGREHTPPGANMPYFGPPTETGTARSAGPPDAPARWRRRPWWIAGALAAVVLVVAASVGAVMWGDDSPAGYQPQSLSHVHGTTEIAAEPQAVAALGPGDGDAVLSLGVQPVAVVAPPGGMPSWEQQLVVGDVRVLDDPDTAALAAAEPDLIIDTGDIDEATYNKLGVIAPTVTRPQNAAPGWGWQNQLTWIGRILGRAEQAQQLIDSAAAKQGELRAANPAFDGKSIEVVNVADAGITATLSGSAAADYLEGLGFRYNDDLKRNPTDTADVRPVPDPEVLNQAPTDVRIVVRTDAGAGNGSYNGLPKPFTTYRGATVIVDDPAVISALGTGGYAATEYLNSTFVEALARQVH